MYIVIIRRLNYAVRRKHQQLVSPSLQSSIIPVGFRQAFLSKEKCYKLELPQYSPVWVQPILTFCYD